MVSIKNTSNSNVVISVPDLDFRRELVPSRTVSIEKEKFEELAFDPGLQSLIRGGFLTVSGLDEEEVSMVEAPLGETTTREDVKKIYKAKDYAKFVKLVKNASPAAKEIITQVAVEEKLTDTGFVQLIKQYCDNFDVIGAINFQHQATEE